MHVLLLHGYFQKVFVKKLPIDGQSCIHNRGKQCDFGINQYFALIMRLSAQARAQAIGQIQAGRTYRAVAAVFGVSVSTISRLHHKFITTGSVADLPRPGQPRVTSRHQDRNIRLLHLRHRFRPASETAKETRGRTRRRVSATTIRRRLRDAGISCHRPYHGARLTANHRRLRRNWAAAHLHWRNRQWQDVVFTDESKIMCDHSDKRIHVYRRRGERFSDACVREIDRWGRASTMIWGGISHHGQTDLVFLDNGAGRGAGRAARRGRGLTAQRYVDEVLRPVAVPFIRQHPGMILQQDNARPHVARLTMQYLQRNNIDVLQNWPALSADLNPIEHCWDYLKKRVARQHPANVNDLRNAIRREWNRIPLWYIRRLIGSMRRRCRAVVNAAGGHTRY